MARPLRIAFEGAFYHITARGNERKKFFFSHRDYEKFLSYLTHALQKYGVILHAYVLMPNHYHLMIETPRANLSSFMHGLNSAYTTYFNIRRKRSGHLFQGRYKALLIDVDNYLLDYLGIFTLTLCVQEWQRGQRAIVIAAIGRL